MQTRTTVKPPGFYLEFSEAEEIPENHVQEQRSRNTLLSHFVHDVNYAIVCALRRKRTQIVNCNVQISCAAANTLRDVFELTGRFRVTPILDQLPIVKSIKIRDDEFKMVHHFEARIYRKRAIEVTELDGKKTSISSPFIFSFKIASKLVIQPC